jgi:hypothetical protein
MFNQPKESAVNIHKRALAAAAVAAIGAGAAVPAITGAHASSAKTQTLHFFDKPVSISLTTAGGKVVSHPPYPQAQAGDVLNVYSLDYPGNHSRHASHWTMSTHLSCTFAQGPPSCIGNVAVGGSLLVFDGNKLVGATGAYQGATGRVLSTKEIPGTNNQSDIVVRIKRR